MHILIIPSEEFVPDYSPTAGIFQHHQAAVLVKAGHSVGVISIRQSFSIPMILKANLFKLVGKKVSNACDRYSFLELCKLAYRKMFTPAYFSDVEKRDGISIIRIDGFYYKPPVENENHFGWIKAGLAAYEKYIQLKGKPDIIHAHNAIYAGMLSKKINEKHGIPYIITEHSTVFARNLIRKNSLLKRVRQAYANSSYLTAVSEPFCELLNKIFADRKFQCLPNVLDPDFEGKRVTPFDNREKEFLFVNIAELHPKKDHELLIRAFKKVHEKYPCARLWIGGDGILSAELNKLVEKEQLQEAVIFLGLLDREQVFTTLQKADCFVLPSKYETFGVVVIEAMLLGKPVVVSRCGGPESFVTSETGIVIEKENEQNLVDAMIQMLSKASSYDNVSIRQYALNNFGSERFARHINEVFSESLKQRRLQ